MLILLLVNFTNIVLQPFPEPQLLLGLHKVNVRLGKILGLGVGLLSQLKLSNHQGQISLKLFDLEQRDLKLGSLMHLLLPFDHFDGVKLVLSVEGRVLEDFFLRVSRQGRLVVV